jgi:hypothetical protein
MGRRIVRLDLCKSGRPLFCFFAAEREIEDRFSTAPNGRGAAGGATQSVLSGPGIAGFTKRVLLRWQTAVPGLDFLGFLTYLFSA